MSKEYPDNFEIERRIKELEAKLAKIKNICSESELHKHECECMVCQVFNIASSHTKPAIPVILENPIDLSKLETLTYLPDDIQEIDNE